MRKSNMFSEARGDSLRGGAPATLNLASGVLDVKVLGCGTQEERTQHEPTDEQCHRGGLRAGMVQLAMCGVAWPWGLGAMLGAPRPKKYEVQNSRSLGRALTEEEQYHTYE